MVRPSFPLLIFISFLFFITTLYAENNRQRIAESISATHRIDAEFSLRYFTLDGDLLLGNSTAIGYEYDEFWRLSVDLPLSALIPAASAIALGLGDLTLTTEFRVKDENRRHTYSLSWIFPSGEANPYRVRTGALESGNGEHRIALGYGLSILRDPTVLALSLDVSAPLFSRQNSGLFWSGAALGLNLSLHEVLNDNASISILVSPLINSPAWRNGEWMGASPHWATAVQINLGWYQADHQFMGGVSYLGDGAWALVFSIGGWKEWREEDS